MIKIYTARLAAPGMPLRQQALDLAAVAPDHKLLSKELISTDHNPNNDRYKITTNQGTWIFRHDEKVTFPRRPDGSARDWRGHTPPPLPLDLAIGDFLDPADGPYQLRENLSPEQNAAWSADHYARVSSITRVRTRPNVVTIGTYSPIDGMRNWTFYWNEPVVCANQSAQPHHTGYDPINPQLTGYGPYLYVDHTTADEYLIFYVTHPAGRGRWPSYLRNMINIGSGTYLAKPPNPKGEWPPFVGERWGRHPRDPDWELDPSMGIEPARVEAAYTAYNDYRDRVGASEHA